MKKTKEQLFKLQYFIFKQLDPETIYELYEHVLDDFLNSKRFATNLMKKKIRKELEEPFFKSIQLFKKNLAKNKELLFPTYSMFFLKDVFNEYTAKYPNSIKSK